ARFSETPIGSAAAAPKAAIAPRDHAEARLITGQGGVFRHLEFLLDRVIAFAVLAELFDLGRGFLVQREHVLRILLGAKPSPGCPGWPGISRSQSIASTFLMKTSVSSG